MVHRHDLARGAVTVLAVSILSLLFIASYAGALHRPRPHDVPIVVTAQVPPALAQRLGASGAFAVDRAPTPQEALRRLDRREDYVAITAAPRGLTVVVSQAASAAVAQLAQQDLVTQLRAGVRGTPVAVRVVHPLPADDARGLVGFYTAVGWVVAGYLGATLVGLAFGTRPARPNTMLRLAGLLALGLITGIAGALVARAIGGWQHGLGKMWLFGTLTVLAVGAATMAFQHLMGILGTGVAILLFVVLGNPSGGGPYATELLPGFWRTIGPLLPPGATTTGLRDAAYFPAASIGGPLLVLLAWLVAGAAIVLVLGDRGRGMTPEEQTASAVAFGA